ncbi:MAG: SDR family NAD(P)-dependent oxidoreductase, partial [Thermoplasmata archaeon]
MLKSVEKMKKNSYLRGKKALVTGASRGIGKAIALTLAEHGADVVVNYHTSAKEASKAATTVEISGEDSWVYPADVSSFKEVTDMKASVEENFGRIDILVNNAGMNVDTFFTKMDYKQWDKVMSVNLDGVFNCTRAFI